MELPLPHPGRGLQRQPAHEALQKVSPAHILIDQFAVILPQPIYLIC